VKSEELRPLFERAKKISQTFETFRIDHIYREQNKEADALVNQALDETAGKPATAAPANAEKRALPNLGIRVRARFRSGVLYPLEDINLPDGADVEILIRQKKNS
jgi:hypothetical protein